MQQPKKIFLDSRNATVSSNNVYSFILTTPIDINNYISLECAQLLNNHWNIDTPNSWLDVYYGGSTNSLQFPLGNWSVDNLVSQLQTLLQTINSGFTVTYITATSQIQIQSSAGAFSLLFGSGPNASKSMWSQLGFSKGVDTTSTSNLIAPNPPDLNSPAYVWIDIDNINDYTLKNSQPSFDTMYAVDFKLQKGSIETWSSSTDFKQVAWLMAPQKSLGRLDLVFYTTVTNVGSSNYNFYNYPFFLIFEYQ